MSASCQCWGTPAAKEWEASPPMNIEVAAGEPGALYTLGAIFMGVRKCKKKKLGV